MAVKFDKNSGLIENAMGNINDRHLPGREIILEVSILTLTKSSLLNAGIPEVLSPIASPNWGTLPLNVIG